MHILIVDDDEDLREVLALSLDAEGHEVDVAVDGLDALEKLLGGLRPDAVFVDMMMPRLDGEALIEAMRAHAELASIPIVIISGHHAARQKAAQLGVAACLVKPIELDQLLAIIERIGAGAAVGRRQGSQGRLSHPA